MNDDNQGAGAPKNNKNNFSTGINADPTGMFDWLWENEPEGARWIIEKLLYWQERASYDLFEEGALEMEDIEEFDENLTAMGDEVLSTVFTDYIQNRGKNKQMQEGLTKVQYVYNGDEWVEAEEENAVNLPVDRLSRNSRQHKKELGLLDTPEEQQAEATDEFAEAMRELAEQQDSLGT